MTFDVELLLELQLHGLGGGSQMHEVAKAATLAVFGVVLPAAALAEVSDGRELWSNGTAGIEAASQAYTGLRSGILVIELDIDIANQVVARVLANVNLLHVSELGKLLPHVQIKLLQVLLQSKKTKGEKKRSRQKTKFTFSSSSVMVVTPPSLAMDAHLGL